jgi:hypothetical protein
MAANDIKALKELASGGFREITLTPADIGAAPASHTHAASDITSGTLNIGRIPTGTGSTQVALGNHTHALSAITDAGTAAAQDANQDLGTGDQVTFQGVTVNGPPVNEIYPGEGVVNCGKLNLDTYAVDLGGGSTGDGFPSIVFGAINGGITLKGPEGDITTSKVINIPNASGTLALTSNFAAPPAIGNTTPAAGTFTTLTANNGTVTASAPVLDLAQTWSASGTTFTGLRLNVTNTASAAASLLADLQVGGATQFWVNRDGVTAATGLRHPTSTSNQIFIGGSASFNSTNLAVSNSAVRLSGQLPLTWGPTTNSLDPADLVLLRDAAQTLAQRNGTNAQTFNIYNTFTSATNHERGFLKWSSNVFQIGTEKGSGGGTARALEFQTDGVTRMTLNTAGQLGIGLTAPERPLHIQTSDAMGRIDRTGANGPAFLMIRMATLGTVTSSWLFGPATGFASVANDDFSIIDFGTNISGTSGTQRLTIAKSDGQLTVNGNLNLSTKNLVTDTTTGTKIGTGTTQRIGFFGATPVVQQAAVADATNGQSTQDRLNDLLARLRTLGLIAT